MCACRLRLTSRITCYFVTFKDFAYLSCGHVVYVTSDHGIVTSEPKFTYRENTQGKLFIKNV